MSEEAVCRLAVRLSPRARADAVVGWQGSELKVRVAAPPAGGAANQALLKFLAVLLNLSVGRLSLAAGQGSRRKIVRIEGLSEAELRRRLPASPPSSSPAPRSGDRGRPPS